MPNNNQTQTRLQQAITLLKAGQLQDSRRLLEDVCRTEHENADSWLLLAAVNGQLGDPAMAEACARTAIRLQPEKAEAWFNLGIALRVQKKTEEAARSLQNAISLKPDYAEAYNALAYIHAISGDIQTAEQHLREAIRYNPCFADAHNNLGNILKTQSRHEEAIGCYRTAVECHPEHIDAMLNLATTLSKLVRLDEAIEWDRRILKLRPDYAEAHYHLGNLLLGTGDLEEAVESFSKSIELKPDMIEAIGAEAQALQKLGRMDESCERIISAIESGKRGAAVIVALAAVAKQMGKQEQALALADELLTNPQLTVDERQQLHFACGKLHDEQHHYREAFEHFRQGNRLYNAPFNRGEHESLVSSNLALFRVDRMNDLPRSSIFSERPVFIVGMPRSGTSLVEQILASHPDIHGAGELDYINQFANTLQAQLGTTELYPMCLGAISVLKLDEMARQYLGKLQGLDISARRVTDKMPHNFLHLGMIAMLFPGARIIHIKRDPMDNCMSIYFHKFNNLHAYAHDLSDLGFYYRAYETLMHHWREVIDLPLLEIRYEDLTTDPDTWIPRLISFCDVEWDSRCLRFHETRRTVNTPSSEQVRQPMYSRSIGRWRHYAEQLEPLRAELELFAEH